MLRAIIFDFDGVIVLSEPARFAALQSIAERHGVTIADSLFREIVGKTTKDFFAVSLPLVAPEVLDTIIADYTVEYKDRITDFVTPLAPTVDFIRGYRGSAQLCVASASDTKVLETVLAYLDIHDKFRLILGKEHVAAHKPDPAVYRLVVDKLRLNPEECIVIEDSAVGAQAAVAANIPVYVLLNGVNRAPDFAGMPISGFIKTPEDYQRALA